ncbi:MAG: hypothetical protein HFE64_02640 [Lachnospiraceae bacterium]|jgi:hypothetical protein|nr:hypothetical protein [Lachnospiraceae bacterium]
MKRLFSCLLIFLLTLSITGCGQKDPVLSLLSKMETASLEESIVDFSEQISSIIKRPAADFQLDEYLKDDSSDPDFTYYKKEITVFNHPCKLTLSFTDNQLTYLDIDFDSPLTEAEISSLQSILTAHFSLYKDSTFFDIGNETVLVFWALPDILTQLSYGIPLANQS